MSDPDHIEVFYDDTCPLCKGTVRWLSTPRSTPLTFAPLQSGTFADKNMPEAIRRADSIVVHQGGRWLTESRAIEEILRHTPGKQWLQWLMRLLPRWLKDAAYRWVARHRHLIAPY